MELQDALTRIADIHQQMARTRIFRGYRAATTAFTGLLAIAAAAWQTWAGTDVFRFVELWVAVAIVSLVVVGVEIVQRYRRSDSPLDRELTLLAIEQFLPCLVIGGLVTFVLCDVLGQGVWMLPGLWQILFGLGMFASRRLLPGGIIFVGAFYLMCGLLCLSQGPGPGAFIPWRMGLPFGLGQLAAAALLHWKLERNHESK